MLLKNTAQNSAKGVNCAQHGLDHTTSAETWAKGSKTQLGMLCERRRTSAGPRSILAEMASNPSGKEHNDKGEKGEKENKKEKRKRRQVTAMRVAREKKKQELYTMNLPQRNITWQK